MSSKLIHLLKVIALALAALTCPASANTSDDADFMKFPLAGTVSSATGPAFAWLVQQGDDTMVMLARAPTFKPVRLFKQKDVDGEPISDVSLAPDGRFVIFRTGMSWGEKVYNPASRLEPPKARWWVMEARLGATPVEVSAGSKPFFSPDGRQLLFRQQLDLWAIDLGGAQSQAKLLAKGAGKIVQPVWAKDGKSFYFIQDRGAYAYLGQYRLGAARMEWLVTGPNRLGNAVLSPDGQTIAYQRFAGHEHGVVRDNLDSEPFAIDTVDIATGTVRTLWETQKPSVLFGRLEDSDHALRWIGNDRLVFFSEHDGWGRLYAISRTGGPAGPLTPTNCEAAESEFAGAETLLIVHNCRDLDARQLSLVNVRTGKEQPLASNDIVMANATAAENSPYVAFTGGNAEDAPLLRIMDVGSRKLVLTERARDYGYQHRFTGTAPTSVQVRAADGGTVPAQLFLPTTPGPHPAIVYVHGGPPRQMYPAFHYSAYYANDYAINRRFAELGYVVLSINYRSGIGYGRAFREPEKRAWRGASEYQDVVGAARWLGARSDVDRKRIGIWGGSYGGLLTGQALARNSNLFAAGVAAHGVFDWSRPSPTPGHLNPSLFFGVSEEDRLLALKSSPVGAIDGWRSPVLLFTGDEDMNVDMLETIDLATKLKRRNVDVRTVLIPGEAHSFVRHQTYRRLWSEAARFFGETLRKK